MSPSWIRLVVAMLSMVGSASAQAAVDSYRFAHVTIATPWYIFLFLMGGIMAPFILMAILAWRSAMRKAEIESDARQNPSVE